jgi:hypothetical protein
MTVSELERRIDHFFSIFETELKHTDFEDYDPTIDYFDLENLFIARYWLHRAKEQGLLDKFQIKQLVELDKQFKEQGFLNFGLSKHKCLRKWLTKEDINEVDNSS